MWSGHRALRYYLMSASEAMKTWAKCVYMGQEFAVNNIVRFYGSESQFAIHDDPSLGSRSNVRDPKIVKPIMSS